MTKKDNKNVKQDEEKVVALPNKEAKEEKVKKEVNTQDPITQDELATYLTYMALKKIDSKEHAKEIKHLSRRTTTLGDVSTVTRVLLREQEDTIMNLIELIQIQERVLLKIGATEDTFKEAQKEYKLELEETRRQLEKEEKEKKDKEKKKDNE